MKQTGGGERGEAQRNELRNGKQKVARRWWVIRTLGNSGRSTLHWQQSCGQGALNWAGAWSCMLTTQALRRQRIPGRSNLR